MEHQYKAFAYMRHNASVVVCTDFELLDNRYISVNGQEPAPIEDYAPAMLFQDVPTKKQAFNDINEMMGD